MRLILCLIFLLSGASALLFETLWFHQAGLALGNSIWASSLVLSGFMGGLALGNGLTGRFGHHVRRPLLGYAVLELTIAGSGLALVYLFPQLTALLKPLLIPFVDAPWILNSVRLGLAFTLLLVPSAAMGATLPMLVTVLYRRDPHFGRVLGRLYGWNAVGAVLGALIGEMLLIEHFGVRGSALFAAGFNVFAALVALGLWLRPSPEAAEEKRLAPAALTSQGMWLLAAAFVCGGILLALEVVWFRFLLLFVNGSSLTFAVMLAVVLLGIALGGLIGGRWLSWWPDAHRWLPALALASGATTVLVYWGFDWFATGVVVPTAANALKLAVPLMLPVAILSGVMFILLGEALNRESPGETQSAGLLALANTTGSMLGPIAAAFFMLPVLGIERSFLTLAGAYVVVALFTGLADLRPTAARGAVGFAVAVALFVGAVVFFPHGRLRERYLSHMIDGYGRTEQSVPVSIREGLTETITYLRKDRFGEPLYYRLVTNAYSMSGTGLNGHRYMKLFVYLPVALHPNPRNALLISYGTGGTAKALTDTEELTHIDMVDISRDIVEANRIVYDDSGFPPDDPRVEVHVEDGRFFLLTSERRYDIITGEPPPPKAAGIVNLYSKEYFELLRARLAEGGIATYWLPSNSLLERESRSLIAAFCAAFDDCSLWEGNGLNFILMGTREAQGPVSRDRFEKQWRTPGVAEELVALGLEKAAQLGALFIADGAALRALAGDAPPIDDDHPLVMSNVIPGQAQLQEHVGWTDVEAADRRFRESETIRRLWPPDMRDASLPYFEYQRAINYFFLKNLRDPAVRFSLLHAVLTQSDLETLVLWIAGTSAQDLAALKAAQKKGKDVRGSESVLAAEALARRDYERAAQLYDSARKHSRRADSFLQLRLYAMALAGRLDEVHALALEHGILEATQGSHERFWRFMERAFPSGVTPEPSPAQTAAGR